jgi:RNA polymerase sigma-70 factor (ECF subfamily)
MHNISDEQDLEKSYIREERKIQLHKIIARLIPDYRQVLYLIFFEGFGNQEAAKIMRKSDKQMKNLVFRAKQALKKELEKDDFEYEEL